MEQLRSAFKPALAVGLLALGLFLASHYGVLDARFPERARAFLVPWGPWAPIAFLVLKVAFVLLVLPAPPLILAGGLLFGWGWGAALNWVGMVAGTVLTFFIGRAVGREAVERRLKGTLAQVDAGLATNGFSFMLFWRLMPVFPDALVNYGAGLTRVRFRDYLLGTLIGVTPSTVVYSYLGSVAAGAAPEQYLLGISCLALLALLPMVIRAASRARPGGNAP